MVLLVCLLSLFMPDFAAAFVGLGVAGISYISDIIFQIMQNAMVKSALGNAYTRVSVWRTAWPKVSSLQYYAVSLVDKSPFHSMGPVHPLVNILLYTAIAAVLIAVAFQKREM
jgi:hypothetical protein